MIIELVEVQEVGGWRCRHCQRKLVYWKRGYSGPDYARYHIRCAATMVSAGVARYQQPAAATEKAEQQ